MNDERLNTKIVTPEIVCSFPVLAEPGEDLSGKRVYSLSISIPKEETEAVEQLHASIKNAAINAWGQKYGSLAGVRHFVKELPDDDPVCPGGYRLTAKSKRQAQVLFPNLKPVPQERIEEIFYPGCIVRASVSAYGTEAGGGKTIAFGLQGVLFVKDGQPLTGGGNVAEDFAGFANREWQDDPFQESAADLF